MVESGGNMPAFSGKYYFTVDPKGRIIIPAPFREIIRSNYGSKLYISNAAFEKCLHIYPQEEWDNLQEKMRGLPRSDKAVKFFMRKVIGSAQETELDKQGRVLIPSAHREDSGVHINEDIVIVGQLEKIELWHRKEWDTVVNPDLSNIESFEDKLSEFGI